MNDAESARRRALACLDALVGAWKEQAASPACQPGG